VRAFRVDSFNLLLLAAGRKLLAADRKLLAAGRNAQIQYAARRTCLR
jgi:hypothetical protein